jgi:DNA-binding transcriptional regulator YdaS (Cro superfamily)
MDLKTYFADIPLSERKSIAEAAGTKWVYLSQIIRGWRQPSTELAQRLHSLTEGKVALHTLRPDVWAA